MNDENYSEIGEKLGATLAYLSRQLQLDHNCKEAVQMDTVQKLALASQALESFSNSGLPGFRTGFQTGYDTTRLGLLDRDALRHGALPRRSSEKNPGDPNPS